MKAYQDEISNKERFEFGENWKEFLLDITDTRIKKSEEAIKEMLELDSLKGKTFLDIGCGSGLSSLAAKNMGAEVRSFDFDDASVWCTEKLKSQYHADDTKWQVTSGSILDQTFLNSLKKHDIVYSWGVLHHTGEMWRAIDNSLKLVETNGLAYIAIYNDQGLKSHFWWMIKWLYCHLPNFLKKPFAYSAWVLITLMVLIKHTLKLQPMNVLGPILNYKNERGMSRLKDVIDWYGGFPFEFAKYDTLVRYVENKGFTFVRGQESCNIGCHQLVFQKNANN